MKKKRKGKSDPLSNTRTGADTKSIAASEVANGSPANDNRETSAASISPASPPTSDEVMKDGPLAVDPKTVAHRAAAPAPPSPSNCGGSAEDRPMDSGVAGALQPSPGAQNGPHPLWRIVEFENTTTEEALANLNADELQTWLAVTEAALISIRKLESRLKALRDRTAANKRPVARFSTLS